MNNGVNRRKLHKQWRRGHVRNKTMRGAISVQYIVRKLSMHVPIVMVTFPLLGIGPSVQVNGQ